MELIRKTGLLFMFLLLLALPTDGMTNIAGLAMVKVAGLMVFGLTAVLVITGTDLRGEPWFFLFSLLYVSWALFSFLWTPMPVNYESIQAINSQQSLKAHLYLLALLLLMFQVIRTEQDLQYAFVAFMLGTLGLMFLLARNYDPGGNTVRYQIQGFDANETAVQIAMTIPLAIYLLTLSKVWLLRVFSVAYLPVAMFAIMITGSRTGAVIMLLGLMGFIPWLWRASLPMKAVSTLALVLALVGVASVINEKTLERLFTTGSEISQGTLNERSVTWSRAYEEWDTQPVFGHGLGSFRRVINRHNIDYTAHNSFVAITVEQGVVGLALYAGVIFVAVFSAFRLDSGRRMIMLSLLLVVLMGQMALTLYENMYIWFAYLLPVLVLGLRNEQFEQAQAVSA